ncbi:MAG: protein serine/threonine phosphatase [Solirubrobacterales bacterium]|nr:protein serine/threonine phosphatase [Solirubrobacterales bacterium]
MLRVAEQYAVTDTGRQRRANEDSLLARSPLFVVADGMGGAQAGEVASRIAIESFQPGLKDGSEAESGLAELARAANSRIHELSHSNAEQAGMGTTLTAVYVGEDEVAIAHVGDSRAYCLRDGTLLRLTDDHSLVDELMRQGRLTPEEAVEHPQRSVITRALGPEGTVEVDTRSYRARAGDVYLLCSDGLTTMLAEEDILELLLANPRLRDAGEALIAAANEAGGRDNITVVLLRLEDVHAATAVASEHDGGENTAGGPATGDQATGEHSTIVGMPAVAAPVSPRAPRRPAGKPPADATTRARRRRRIRRAGVAASVIAVLGVLGSGAYLAMQSVYFIGTNGRGLVTIFRGVPFSLPGNVPLYSRAYVSGVGASTVTPDRRRTLLDHSLRSESSAASLVRSLELGQLE